MRKEMVRKSSILLMRMISEDSWIAATPKFSSGQQWWLWLWLLICGMKLNGMNLEPEVKSINFSPLLPSPQFPDSGRVSSFLEYLVCIWEFFREAYARVCSSSTSSGFCKNLNFCLKCTSVNTSQRVSISCNWILTDWDTQ